MKINQIKKFADYSWYKVTKDVKLFSIIDDKYVTIHTVSTKEYNAVYVAYQSSEQEFLIGIYYYNGS